MSAPCKAKLNYHPYLRMPARKKSRSRPRPKKGKRKVRKASQAAQIKDLRQHVNQLNKELDIIYAKRRGKAARRRSHKKMAAKA